MLLKTGSLLYGYAICFSFFRTNENGEIERKEGRWQAREDVLWGIMNARMKDFCR